MALRDFTLSNARRFYSSMGNPLGLKGLSKPHFTATIKQIDRSKKITFSYHTKEGHGYCLQALLKRYKIKKSSAKKLNILSTFNIFRESVPNFRSSKYE